MTFACVMLTTENCQPQALHVAVRLTLLLAAPDTVNCCFGCLLPLHAQLAHPNSQNLCVYMLLILMVCQHLAHTHTTTMAGQQHVAC